MLDHDSHKHAAEFARHLRNHAYEATDDGAILFPRAGAIAQGGYLHSVNGGDERFDKNLLPTQGLVHMLAVCLGATAKLTAWHLSLYGANYTPAAGLTAASYPATANEITSNTEGYTEVSRRVWSPTAPTTPLIDNLANRATFTIATASSLTVHGAALTSESVKGATTGTLLSATKFTAARVLYDTDVFNLAYRVTLSAT